MRKLRQRTMLGLVHPGLATLGVAACSGGYGEYSEDLGELQEALTVTHTFREGMSGYSGTTDTYLRQSNPTTNYGSSTTCHVDGDDGSGVDKSCVIRWALSGVPSDAIVTSATITLQALDAGSTYQVYQLNRSFNESQATWSNAASGSAWGSPGALAVSDRGPQVGEVGGSSGSKAINLNAAGVAMVQGWVNGGNHGIIVANASVTGGIDFASSEHGTSSYRPQLSITYTTNSGGGGGGGSGSGGSGSGGSGSSGVPGGTPQANVLIAFMGDQGNGSNADAVLNLIKNEGAQAVVHNGDFDYASNPNAFENRINAILGADFPYYAVIGNHDASAWSGSSGYSSKQVARAARVPSMNCTGELGVKANCNFRGVHLIESCIGVSELRSTCGPTRATR